MIKFVTVLEGRKNVHTFTHMYCSYTAGHDGTSTQKDEAEVKVASELQICKEHVKEGNVSDITVGLVCISVS